MSADNEYAVSRGCPPHSTFPWMTNADYQFWIVLPWFMENRPILAHPDTRVINITAGND